MKSKTSGTRPEPITETDSEIIAAEAAGELTGSAEHAGMGRGDHPRESKSRETASRARAIEHHKAAPRSRR